MFDEMADELAFEESLPRVSVGRSRTPPKPTETPYERARVRTYSRSHTAYRRSYSTVAMASLLSPRTFASSVCQSCRLRLKPAVVSQRSFSSTQVKPVDSALFGLQNISENNARRRSRDRVGQIEESLTDILASPSRLYNDAAAHNLDAASEQKAHRLHVLATKHNTHLTLVQPPKPASQTTSSGISSTNASAADQKKMVDVLLSISSGNIGFKKAGRGSYDAAYQLTAFTLKTMQERGMMHDIKKLEIVMRGFGAGREAFTKAILGSEGRNIRDRISAVLDATRLKIGGTRSPKPRRLG
jgi:small subunit ribosomal protein S11